MAAECVDNLSIVLMKASQAVTGGSKGIRDIYCH